MSDFNRVQLESNSTEQRPAASEYIGTVNGEPAEGGFNNTTALAKAMEDSRYREDAAYREAVQRLVVKTTVDALAGPQVKENPRAAEDCEVVCDTITGMMADPRYKTSAAYRRAVERKLSESMPYNVRVENTGTDDQRVHRVTVKI